MENITRRQFVNATGAAVAGAALASASVVSLASAEEAAGEPAPLDYDAIDAAVEASKQAARDLAAQGVPQAEIFKTIDVDWVDPNTWSLEEHGTMVEPEVEGDLVLPDGSVVPEVYVRLRNRINHIGKGLGLPDEHAYEMIMHMWSPEDAQHELEMPLMDWFLPYEYALMSGRDEAECREILADMSLRGLIFHAERAGQDYYHLIPHINGFWEFGELYEYFSHGGVGDDPYASEEALQAVHEFNARGIMSNVGHECDMTFPLFRSYPISKDVIAEDDFAPYMDWRRVIERQPIITVSPCQCRLWDRSDGRECDHPFETCLSLGEVAEYFLENGIGRQITQDEAIAVMEDAIDRGMIPESIVSRDVDIFCCCHGDCCKNMLFHKLSGGGTSAWKNWNAYTLEYDQEKCIQCGACIERCPLQSITFNDEGFCLHDTLCVRCGQCVSVCPADARILRAREDYPQLPRDYVDEQFYIQKDRAIRGYTRDFTGTSL